ncbi:MAG: hypothetical protein H2043_11105 [Rhizobiales bacterium]|nr:hypothetical protein [Hyphomicrobiales bacterium]
MSDQHVGPVQLEDDGPALELHRSQRVEAILLTLTLMVLGWFAGRSFAHWFSFTLAGDIAFAGLCLGLGMLVALLAKRLGWFVASDSLILRVSANGLVLGYPTCVTLSWDEVEQVRLIRSAGGKLPVHHLQVTRRQSNTPTATRPEIIHRLGVLWDRRFHELRDALVTFRPRCLTSNDGQKDYNSASWTGLSDPQRLTFIKRC